MKVFAKKQMNSLIRLLLYLSVLSSEYKFLGMFDLILFCSCAEWSNFIIYCTTYKTEPCIWFIYT